MLEVLPGGGWFVEVQMSDQLIETFVKFSPGNLFKDLFHGNKVDYIIVIFHEHWLACIKF